MTSGAKVRSGVMISTRAPDLGDHIRRLQRGVVAGVVIDEHVRARLHIAGDDVPGGDDKIIARLQHVRVRIAAGGDDDDVRVFGGRPRRPRPMC